MKPKEKSRKGRRQREYSGSLTVEAAVLFPFLFTITFLLVQTTMIRYKEVSEQAGILYDAVFQEEKLAISDRIRIADTAFEMFGK